MTADVDSAIAEVFINRDVGDKTKGDLSALCARKFRCQGQLTFLGTLVMIRQADIA